MFDRMETLPIRYFDTHPHGAIMSTYTNDTDAIRQSHIDKGIQCIDIIIALLDQAVQFAFKICISLFQRVVAQLGAEIHQWLL